MYRYQLQRRTYLILTFCTALSGAVLVLALVNAPLADPHMVTDSDPLPRLPGPGGDFLADYRTPVITVSAVAMVGLLGAMALSAGVKYIDRSNVMDSPVRREMYRYIRENPGAYLREISRALDINPTNTTWHLRKLTEADLVRAQMSNGLKLYYPIEGGVRSRDDAIAGAILKNDNARTIIAYLLAHPGGHQREIARALNVNHGTVRWHLKKLVGARVVNEHAEGSAYKYYVSQDGMEYLSRSDAWREFDLAAENIGAATEITADAERPSGPAM